MVNVIFSLKDSGLNEVYAKLYISPAIAPIAYSGSIVSNDTVIVLEAGHSVTVPLVPNTYNVRLIGLNVTTEFLITIPVQVEGTTVNAKDYLVAVVPSQNFSASYAISSSYATNAISASYAPKPYTDIYNVSGSHLIGINQSNPQVTLDVNGDTNIIGTLTVNSDATFTGGLTANTDVSFGNSIYQKGNLFSDGNVLFDPVNNVACIGFYDDHVLYDQAGNNMVTFNGNGQPLVVNADISLQSNLDVLGGNITNTVGDLDVVSSGGILTVGSNFGNQSNITFDGNGDITFYSDNGNVNVGCPLNSNANTTLQATEVNGTLTANAGATVQVGLNVIGPIGINKTNPQATLDFGTYSTGGRPFWLMYNDSNGINMGVWRDTPSQNITGFVTNNGGAFSWGNSTTAALPTFSSEWMRLTNGGDLGIGVTPSARLHSVSTTEQLRVGYNASNYFSTTVSSVGSPTFNAVGTSPIFKFNQNVSGSGFIAAQYINLPYSASAKALTPTVATGSSYVNTGTNLFYVYNGTRWTSASLA